MSTVTFRERVLSVCVHCTAVAVLIQIYGDSPPTVWYEIRITVSKIVATMVLFPIGRKFNRRRTASFANPNSSQALCGNLEHALVRGYLWTSTTWSITSGIGRKNTNLKLREITLNLRFTYRCLVECSNALQYQGVWELKMYKEILW